MKLKVAFAGLRHAHIFSLYDSITGRNDMEIVAVCEEKPEESLMYKRPDITLTYNRFDEMLRNCPCDIIAVGDYYGKRGAVVIKALQAGKHVICDKPLCTSSDELDEIKRLAVGKRLCIGVMLDLRTSDSFVEAKKIIDSGKLGKITQIQFNGQHPLNLQTRPSWYFEPGKHGGTLNDIAIHAVDYIRHLTGMDIDRICSARTWRAFGSQSESFYDAAQCMMVLSNGCGVIGDVSYAEPDSFAFNMPQYWRFTIWGTGGVIEFNAVSPSVNCWFNGEKEVRSITAEKYPGENYLDYFLRDIAGKDSDMDTAWVLKCSAVALALQKFADEERAGKYLKTM